MYFGSPVAGPFTVGDGVLIPHSVLKMTTKKISLRGVSQHHWNQMQFFSHWSHKAPCKEGRWNGTLPVNASCGHRRVLLLSTQPHCLTKQYWCHWSRTVLVIALPNRFEWKDMEAYYFGSVCESMGTLLEWVIF